tara:strand:+ start:292 stop:861 length:570 start_codon:yes stop_codon:yes gene_type:complete
VKVFFKKSLLVAVMLGGLTSCRHDKPNMTYMPDMHYSPAVKAQEQTRWNSKTRVPVEGTIPRGYHPYRYSGQPEKAGQMLKNPLRRTKTVLNHGRDLFNTYCIVCHGKFGEGDGYIIPKYPRPPSLQSDKIRNYPDGRIYHIITEGQNLMPSYASQILQEDRWAIIHYIRVLQRAKKPTASDLKKLENW